MFSSQKVMNIAREYDTTMPSLTGHQEKCDDQKQSGAQSDAGDNGQDDIDDREMSFGAVQFLTRKTKGQITAIAIQKGRLKKSLIGGIPNSTGTDCVKNREKNLM